MNVRIAVIPGGAGITNVRRGLAGGRLGVGNEVLICFSDLDAGCLDIITSWYTLLICAFFWLYVIIQ